MMMAGQQCQWRSWDKDTLDKMYSPSVWAKQESPVDHHIEVLVKATREAQASLRTELGVEYDVESGQTLDIYHPTGEHKGEPCVVVYFHGGYWQAMGLEHSGYIAHQLCSHGVTLIAVGYDLAPKANMTTIVKQCTLAYSKVLSLFPNGRVFLCGHSAGAHLAMCVIGEGRRRRRGGQSPDCCEGVILLSGVYDLGPIQQSYVNGPLNLTDSEVQQFSPQGCVSSLELPKPFRLLVVAAEHDPAEFKRQAEDYHKCLLGAGLESQLVVVAGEDHFTVIERLVEEHYSLTQVMLEFLEKH